MVNLLEKYACAFVFVFFNNCKNGFCVEKRDKWNNIRRKQFLLKSHRQEIVKGIVYDTTPYPT